MTRSFNEKISKYWNAGFLTGIATGIILTCISFCLLYIIYLSL